MTVAVEGCVELGLPSNMRWLVKANGYELRCDRDAWIIGTRSGHDVVFGGRGVLEPVTGIGGVWRDANDAARSTGSTRSVFTFSTRDHHVL